jgi:hypothetical protein
MGFSWRMISRAASFLGGLQSGAKEENEPQMDADGH